MACEMARAVERAGGDAVLLLPPYLVHSEQDGLFRHIRTVCAASRLRLFPTVATTRSRSRNRARLARDCPNLVALKDGTGDLAGVAQ